MELWTTPEITVHSNTVFEDGIAFSTTNRQITSDTSLNIVTNTAGSPFTWEFGANGVLSVPPSTLSGTPGVITTTDNQLYLAQSSTTTVSEMYRLTSTQLICPGDVIISAGDIIGQTINNILFNSSYIDINTNLAAFSWRFDGGAGTFISPTSGGIQMGIDGYILFQAHTGTDIDNPSIRATDTNDITLVTDFGGGNYLWVFGSDGTFTIPGDIETDETSMTITLDGPLVYTLASNMTIPGNVVVAGGNGITSSSSVEITANSNTWIFGADGTTTFPGPITSGGITSNTSILLITDADESTPGGPYTFTFGEDGNLMYNGSMILTGANRYVHATQGPLDLRGNSGMTLYPAYTGSPVNLFNFTSQGQSTREANKSGGGADPMFFVVRNTNASVGTTRIVAESSGTTPGTPGNADAFFSATRPGASWSMGVHGNVSNEFRISSASDLLTPRLSITTGGSVSIPGGITSTTSIQLITDSDSSGTPPGPFVFTFAEDGDLELPENLYVEANNGISSLGNINLEILSDSTWSFETGGTLTCPGNVDLETAGGDVLVDDQHGIQSSGNLILGTVGGTLLYEFDGNGTLMANALNVQSTVGDFNIFTGPTGSWNFDTAGDLYTPTTGGSIFIQNGALDTNVITASVGSLSTTANTDMTFTATTGTITLTSDVSTRIRTSIPHWFDFYSGDAGATGILDLPGTNRIQGIGNINFRADTANWQFGTTGRTTLPGEIFTTNTSMNLTVNTTSVYTFGANLLTPGNISMTGGNRSLTSSGGTLALNGTGSVTVGATSTTYTFGTTDLTIPSGAGISLVSGSITPGNDTSGFFRNNADIRLVTTGTSKSLTYEAAGGMTMLTDGSTEITFANKQPDTGASNTTGNRRFLTGVGTLNTNNDAFYVQGRFGGQFFSSGYHQVNNHYSICTGSALNNANTRLSINTSGSIRFWNYGAGTITANASGILTSVSDETIKDIIDEPVEPVWDIKPIKYTFKDDSGLASYKITGFRDVEGKWDDVLKEKTQSGKEPIVSNEKHVMYGFGARDVHSKLPQGAHLNPHNNLYGLDLGALLANAYVCIAELKKQVDELKSEMASIRRVG